jgi:hypothetical protein
MIMKRTFNNYSKGNENRLRIPIIGLALLVAVTFSACEKEYFKTEAVPVVNLADTLSFSNVLVPILVKDCATSGCHSGSVPPNLSADKAYSSLVDGALVDTANAESCVLMVKLNSNMPPSGKLPAGDIQKFLIWIKQGALNN